MGPFVYTLEYGRYVILRTNVAYSSRNAPSTRRGCVERRQDCLARLYAINTLTCMQHICSVRHPTGVYASLRHGEVRSRSREVGHPERGSSQPHIVQAATCAQTGRARESHLYSRITRVYEQRGSRRRSLHQALALKLTYCGLGTRVARSLQASIEAAAGQGARSSPHGCHRDRQGGGAEGCGRLFMDGGCCWEIGG